MLSVSAHDRTNKYIIITPVKDEAQYIAQTLRSVILQTVLPAKWVIVDDGSTDRTTEIIRPYCEYYEWIKLIHNKPRRQRLTGFAEIVAFSIGYEAVRETEHDYVVKLDGDLRLPEGYFEQLLQEFQKNPALGIASGVYLEQVKEGWKPVEMPDYHAAGAAKIVNKSCFEQIGGFISSPGWDTVDEIKALYEGWQTAHFKDIRFYHLKPEGSGMGFARTSRMHGEIYYLTGGGKLFFALKILHRCLRGKPFVIGGAMMLAGYLKCLIARRKLLISADEAKFYRQLLNGRMFRKMKKLLALLPDHRDIDKVAGN